MVRRLMLVTLLAGCFSGPAVVRADTLHAEFWLSGGVLKPEYSDSPLAIGRAGVGAVIAEYVMVGVGGMVDRDHYWGFGYAGLALPAIGELQPFGRLYAGKRHHADDTAMGWSAGIRTGPSYVQLFVEVIGIIQPGSGLGGAVGVSF
jgi:hypothetical protein